MTLLALAIVLLAGAVVALCYALFQPSLANLRSEQMRAESALEPRVKSSTPVYDLIDRVSTTVGWKPFTEEELTQAGIKSTVTSMIATTLLVAFVTFGVSAVLLGGFLLPLVIGVVSPFAVKKYVAMKTARRRRRFAKQMAETMTLLSSGLKAGMNVTTAMAHTAQEMMPPMGEELARIVNESRLGRDFVQGMKDAADRMESKDFMWVAEAVAIQRESGGRLSEILDRVGETIAERNELNEKVKSLAAEGKMSAMVLMALPVVVGLGYTVMNRPYMVGMVESPIGLAMLGAAAVLYALGGFWLSRVTKVNF